MRRFDPVYPENHNEDMFDSEYDSAIDPEFSYEEPLTDLVELEELEDMRRRIENNMKIKEDARRQVAMSEIDADPQVSEFLSKLVSGRSATTEGKSENPSLEVDDYDIDVLEKTENMPEEVLEINNLQISGYTEENTVMDGEYPEEPHIWIVEDHHTVEYSLFNVTESSFDADEKDLIGTLWRDGKMLVVYRDFSDEVRFFILRKKTAPAEK